MSNLTTAQKVYLALLLAVGGAWLGLELGVPVYEYGHGKSALTDLLARIASVLKIAFFGVAALSWVLQSIGVLPTVRPVSTPNSTASSRLRNLAIWIVIALVLVFFFNFFQGTGSKSSPNPAPAQMPDLPTLLINWFPMLIIFGVWIFFLRKMQTKAGQGRNTDKPNDT